MPIYLTHREVRDLAKNLRDLTGRDIKHTRIIEAIAKAVGRPADSMMHELKNENLVGRIFSQPALEEPCSETVMARKDPAGHSAAIAALLTDSTHRRDETMTSEDSRRIAKAAGFEIWDTGGGCTAFAKLLREVGTPGDDVATMDLMITVEGGCSIDAAPEERVWGAGLNYTDPRGGDSPLSTENDLYTLEEAIAKAAEFQMQADEIWARIHDAHAIAEYEGFGEEPTP